jgi:hypothetical protein
MGPVPVGTAKYPAVAITPSPLKAPSTPQKQSATSHAQPPINSSLSEAEFPLMLGTILNSTSMASFTEGLNSSRSILVFGGLKLNCWRAISRHSEFLEGRHERANSCVREWSFSSKRTTIREMVCGESKVIRIVCGPSSAARQLRVSSARYQLMVSVFRADFEARQSCQIEPLPLEQSALKDLFS